MATHVAPGSIVTVRGQPWRVARVDEFDRCSVVTLNAAHSKRLRVIEPFDRVIATGTRRVIRRHRRSVLNTALGTIAAARPALGLWTAASADIELLPYQLEPALAVLRGATRLLIADAVGLGKTIQAGLILSELRERGWMDRALIVCPAGLRETWAAELRRRFGIESDILDHASVAATVATVPPGINPWTTHATAIASIDYVKRAEVLAAICEAPIDLIIADEAHHLTPATDRGAAIGRIASQTPWCVLISATPHSGDDGAFYYLTRMGALVEPNTICRRSRRPAARPGGRRERLVRIRPAANEVELLRAVEDYAQAIWRGNGAGDPAARLVAITIAKRAASSPLALERTLRRRLLLLDGGFEPSQPPLPWDETDQTDDCGAPTVLAVPGLSSSAEERAAVERLLSLITRSGRAAKLAWLSRSLARLGEPAIVFTEYRDTLEAVVAALPTHLRVKSICGSTPIGERHGAIDAFNHGGVDVLVATDTAGEGLNLHHRCRLVIDVELPWNPLRLEQRIGRVDRLGQRRRVHGLRLFHPDTFEERVLERLQLRRRRGDLADEREPLDESAVAASAFGDSVGEPRRRPLVTNVEVEGVAAEHARLLRQRGLRARAMSPPDFVAAVPKRRTSLTMVALHAVTYVNDFGVVMAEEPCAHAVQVARMRATERRFAFVDAVGASTFLRASIDAQVENSCAAIQRQLTPLCRALSTRIDAIRLQIAAHRTREVQRSLFDQRADGQAARADLVANSLDAALARRQCSVECHLSPEATSSRLIAIWPAARR